MDSKTAALITAHNKIIYFVNKQIEECALKVETDCHIPIEYDTSKEVVILYFTNKGFKCYVSNDEQHIVIDWIEDVKERHNYINDSLLRTVRWIKEVSGKEYTVEELKSLKQLHLQKCQIEKLPKNIFKGLNRLEILNLFDNKITKLPEGIFDDLTSLKTLHLGRNKILELPTSHKVFKNLISLKHLFLNDNRLPRLPCATNGTFDCLEKLQTFHLSGNNIKELPDGIFDKLTSLKFLYLNKNKITTIPDGMFDNLTSLQIILLENNPIIKE